MDEEGSDRSPTYAPSFREPDTENKGEEMAENIERFEEELLDIEFEVEMEDGTEYIIDDWDAHAVLMKHGWDDLDEFIDGFRNRVAEHYTAETEPTKLGTVGWGQGTHDDSKPEYDSHADLAPVVLYPAIRAALMQLAMIAMSDEGEDPVAVIGIDPDGAVHQYGEHGRVTFELEE